MTNTRTRRSALRDSVLISGSLLGHGPLASPHLLQCSGIVREFRIAGVKRSSTQLTKGFPMTGHLRMAGMWVPPIVLFSSMRLNDERMKTVLHKLGRARRASVAFLGASLLAASSVSSWGFSPVQFSAVQSQIHADLATVASLPSPTRDERLFLRTLQLGSNVLTKVSTTDGKTLRALNRILSRQASYLPVLGAIHTNLLTGFNAEQTFVENLLPELPESAETTAVKAQFQKFDPHGAKLNAAATVAIFSGLYDGTKRKLDDILIRANQALLIPFPSSLPSPNAVSAVINGIAFRTGQGAATDNVFNAVATETSISLTLGALVNAGGSGPRGILFSIPNAALGAFRHAIPTAAVFTNRSGIYSPEESNVGATNGAIFINATATEVYGVFSCSGPGFNITDGKFRISISSQP